MLVFLLLMLIMPLSGASAELRRGSRGDEVKLLQQMLIDTGFLHDAADGVFGKKTQAAVEAYQRYCGMEINGIADEGVLNDLDIKLQIDNEEILDNLPEGAFITVSNHPYGALDGIILINEIGKRRPEFKVMVNMILNYISAMRPNFIAVDALASDDPKKKAVSMNGIKAAIMHVKQGHPLGFFPAGAISKIIGTKIQDREWQESVSSLIMQL